MSVVENLTEIEAFLVELSDDKRTSLNNPQVIWKAFIAYKRGESEAPKRNRQMTEGAFNKLFAAVDDTLEKGDTLVISIAACRVLDLAVPKEILADQKPYRQPPMRTVYPALPWSPFEMRL